MKEETEEANKKEGSPWSYMAIFQNKKASTVDNLWAVIVLFGFALFLLTMITFWNGIKNEDFWSLSATATTAKNDGQSLIDQFDFLFLCAYFGIHLGLIVLAWSLRTHPVVYVAGILLTAVLVMVAVPISNSYEAIILDSGLVTAATGIPVTNYFMSMLPRFEMVWGFITLILLFGFARGEGFV